MFIVILFNPSCLIRNKYRANATKRQCVKGRPTIIHISPNPQTILYMQFLALIIIILLVKLQRQRSQKARYTPLFTHPEANLVTDALCKLAAWPAADLHCAALAVKDY